MSKPVSFSIDAAQFSDEGKTVRTAGQSIKSWDAQRRTFGERHTRRAGCAKIFRLFEFSRDGRLVAGQLHGSQQIVIWDSRSGKIVRRIDVVDMPLDAAISPDGKLLAVGTLHGKHTGSVQLFDLTSGAALRTMADVNASIHSVAFSPDGQLVAAADHRKVSLWDAASGQLQRTFEGHQGSVESLSFSPDGKSLASGGQGPIERTPQMTTQVSEVLVWNLATGERTWSKTGELSRTIAVAFSPDGRRLAWSDSRILRCDELESGESWNKRFPPTAMKNPKP